MYSFLGGNCFFEFDLRNQFPCFLVFLWFNSFLFNWLSFFIYFIASLLHSMNRSVSCDKFDSKRQSGDIANYLDVAFIFLNQAKKTDFEKTDR